MAALSAEGGRRELRIGPWRVDPHNNEIRRDGQTLRLEPKAVEVLVALARRPGEAVSREELLSAVWPGVVVGDDALTQVIIKLRKALGDDAREPKYIETISKRGYRLIAPVEEGPGAAPRQDVPGQPRRAGRRRLALGLGFGLAALGIALAAWIADLRLPWPLGPDARGTAGASPPVVAVLPFANLSGAPARDYFVDGVTEDIIDALGRFSGIRVLARNAVQGYKGQAPNFQQLRRDLGARYIVQGSVREADGRVRVAVELSDAKQGAQLWSERYEGQGAQLFEIQDRIARHLVGALAVKLTQLEQRRAFEQPTQNAEAYDLVLRARALNERHERGANREARALLAQAAKLAPDYAEVQVVQCVAELHRALYGWIEDITEGTRRAEGLCKRALASSDVRMHSRAHAALAGLYSNERRYEEALDHAEKAIEINPSDASALYRRGMALLYAGRVDEAIAAMETARRFDRYTLDAYNLPIAYHVAGRYADAVAEADALLTHFPDYLGLHTIRAAALAELGRMDEARRAAQEVRRLSPFFNLEFAGSRFVDPALGAKVQASLRKAGL